LASFTPNIGDISEAIERPGSDYWRQTTIGSISILWIFTLWLLTYFVFLQLNPLELSPVVTIAAILLRTFLQTGLFAIAHDAMHASLLPNHRYLNDTIGRVAILLYACLPYDRCRQSHWQHHRTPGMVSDPDFHDSHNWLQWYVRFMKRYLSLSQLVTSAVVWFPICLIWHFCGVGLLPILLFWLLPICLSSLQLFIFGTYLPHHNSENSNRHRARSSDYAPWQSFLTCYHFGYHWEHHEYPSCPWYDLPSTRLKKSEK
jgi:beta-carotene/zeaxanthin 4-ketolase